MDPAREGRVDGDPAGVLGRGGELVAAAAVALLAVAAVCADGASTFYSSDPNLGSARVVFQVTATFHPSRVC